MKTGVKLCFFFEIPKFLYEGSVGNRYSEYMPWEMWIAVKESKLDCTLPNLQITKTFLCEHSNFLLAFRGIFYSNFLLPFRGILLSEILKIEICRHLYNVIWVIFLATLYENSLSFNYFRKPKCNSNHHNY